MVGRKIKNGETEGEMTFLQHLEELRWHIIRSVIAVVVGAIAAFMLKDFIFNQVILAPKSPGFITNRLLCQLADAVNVPAVY